MSMPAEVVPVAEIIHVPERTKLVMLELPTPGHHVAWRWWGAGVAAYLLLSGVMIAALQGEGSGTLSGTLMELIGQGDHKNPTLTVLVVGALFIAVYAMTKCFRDIRIIKAEEVDIEWVKRHGRDGLPLVFADASRREALFQAGMREIPSADISVETLIDDRVRRIHAALIVGGNARVSPVELQGIAEKRTLRYGSSARYASSLLLLLAVLGTFAGVKTALPSLIQALGDNTTNTKALIPPLSAVAGAFGGNALALVGAIALGLIAQGFSTARRHVLERLEMVSSEHIYRNELEAESNPLQAAIVALRNTAREMHEASGTMSGIESGLQGMGSAFRTAFDSLSDRLTDLTAQHENALHDRTHAALEGLRVQVSQLAQATDGNARVYAGLAESVSTRSSESRTAMELMSSTNVQLRSAMDAFVRIGDQAKTSFAQMEQASVTIATQSELATAHIGASSTAVATAVKQLQPALEQMGSAVERVAKIATESDRHVTQTLSELGGRIERLSQSLATVEQAQSRHREAERSMSGRGAEAAGNADVLSVLKRIASSVDQRAPRVPLTVIILGPALGLIGGAALSYFILRLR
jgi:hypothetical protein